MKKFMSRVGRFIDTLRRWLGRLVFLLILLVVLVVVFSSPGPMQVPDQAALVLAPQGYITEQRSMANPADILFGASRPTDALLEELVAALNRAATDPRITALVLDVDELIGISAAHMETLGDALQRFRDSDKPIYSYGEFFDQSHYALVSHADHITLHPMGSLMLTGYGGNQLFFRDLLERLRINVQIFRVGEFKAAAEPFERMDLSDEARADNQALVDALWDRYKNRVAANRDLAPQALQDYADNYVSLLEAAGGNMARVAFEQGLVDNLAGVDSFRRQVAAQVGVDNDSFRQIDYRDYLQATQSPPLQPTDQVGIIVAQGTILPGQQPRGLIGSETVSELIRQAHLDDSVKALVLRIDTPGGSAMASEEIRAALTQMSQSGKPVVVSMGSTAASGGYWIASSADEIWASPATITGSIGVIALMPTFERVLSEIGVGVDGVGTTALSRAGDPLTGLNDTMGAVFQATVDDAYRRFVQLVAEGRAMTIEDVEGLAEGRVWTGQQAFDLGLVDKLGDLSDAIEGAASLAGLDDYQAVYLERPLSVGEQVLVQMMDSIGATGVLAGPQQQVWQRLAAGPLATLWPSLSRPALNGWQSLIDVILPAGKVSAPPRALMLCETCLTHP